MTDPHHHHHDHAPANFGAAFAVGIALNLAYVVGEAFYGLLAHSLALLADAGHNLGDVLGLGAAWLAASLGKRQPTRRYTYGLRRSSILAALANAVLLLVLTGGIACEAIRRLAHPGPVGGSVVMVVAAAGIAINGITALMFAAGRKGDLNIKSAFTHMAADALVSLGVVVAGAVILWTGWRWIDPAVSLIVSLVIVAGTWSVLRDAVGLSLDAVPEGIDPEKVMFFLRNQPGVSEVHDLHVWPMSTTDTALTCHCVMPAGHPGDQFLVQLCSELQRKFGIGHTTIQIETDPNIACALAPDRVV